LGVLGLWDPISLNYFSLVLAILGSVGCWQTLQRYKKENREEEKQRLSFSAKECVVLFFGLGSILIAFFIALTPPIGTDELSYHLALPQAFLNDHAIRQLDPASPIIQT